MGVPASILAPPTACGRRLNDQWDKINAASEDEISRLNERYCVVKDGGRTRVLTFEKIAQKQHQRDIPPSSHSRIFETFFAIGRSGSATATCPSGIGG